MDVHRCRFVDYTPHTITSLAFSHSSTTKFAPSDLRLAVGRNNGDIEIWNPKNKWVHETTMYGAKGRSIEGLVWSTKDGEAPRLFSIGGTTKITEWDLKTGMILKEFDCNAAVIWSVAKNQSQDKIAVGCDDGTVVILDISGGSGSIEHHAFVQRQEARVLSLCWKGDESIIGGCADGRIRVWELEGKRLISTMKVDKSKTESTLVWCVLYLPNLNQIVSGDSTGSVKFWDFQHFTLAQTFKVHDADILTLTTDLNNENVFTAGVDRKIFKFQTNKQNKWVNLSNRLFHSNDIRSMTSFESKNFSFLISAGVEKNIVISSLKSFTDGQYRKLSIVPQQEHVIMNKKERYIVLWQDQTVKIWKLAEDSSYHLVSKLTLADEENITKCAISQDGSILAVGRLTTTKLFKLATKSSNKLAVHKYEHEAINSLGSKNLIFYGNEFLILTTPDNEIYQFNLENGEVKEYELSELPKSKSKLTYLENINHLLISHSKLIVSRSSAVDIIDLESSEESTPFLRLSSYINRLSISPKGTLLLVTHENKIYEFDLKSKHLTNWSKTNSEFLPKEFLELNESPLGMFFNAGNLWIYGANWMCFFNLELNVPVTKKQYKKRSRNGNVIGHSEFDVEDEDEDDEDEDDDMDVETNFAERISIKNDKDGVAYGIIHKYKSILFAEKLNDDELLVIERPQFALKQPPAFKLSQYRV